MTMNEGFLKKQTKINKKEKILYFEEGQMLKFASLKFDHYLCLDDKFIVLYIQKLL